MDYLINFVLAIIGGVVVAEIVFRYKLWCRRIIAAAASLIEDPAARAIRHEEWLAALDESVGLTASLSHAIGCWFGAPAVSAEAKRPVAKMQHRISAKLFKSFAKSYADQLDDQTAFMERMIKQLPNWAILALAGASFIAAAVSFIKAFF